MSIKLNEQKLNKIIVESIQRVLNEEYFMSADNPEEFGFLWDELASAYVTNNSQGNDSVFCEVAFFAVQKMCNNNHKPFGFNARKLANKYYTSEVFKEAFDKIVNNVRKQRLN